MNRALKTITITFVAFAVVSTAHADKKKTISKSGASFGFALKSGGGHTAYPDGTFPTIGTAIQACGGVGNVGSIQDTSDDGVQHSIEYFCAEL